MDTDKIVEIEMEDVFTWDYPDFCDAYISYAVHKDTGLELTDEEIEELNDKHGDFVHEKAHEHYF
jgi:hypothetical protein